jgi:hypothetical protein
MRGLKHAAQIMASCLVIITSRINFILSRPTSMPGEALGVGASKSCLKSIVSSRSPFLRYACTSQCFHLLRATQKAYSYSPERNPDILEFFMFSVRRTTMHPEYVRKTKRITLCHRAKQITLRRDEILLLRLIMDSRILVDLLTEPLP